VLKPFVILYWWNNKSLVSFNVLKDHLMHVLTNAFTSLHTSPNSDFGIFQSMRTVRLTYWLNKH
jgi:hypothetical protein